MSSNHSFSSSLKLYTKEGYDSTYKYQTIWDVMTFNINQFIEKASHDLSIDETIWTNNSYAPVHSCIAQKTGVNKGGQHTI